jgi:hypothetical protein
MRERLQLDGIAHASVKLRNAIEGHLARKHDARGTQFGILERSLRVGD